MNNKALSFIEGGFSWASSAVYGAYMVFAAQCLTGTHELSPRFFAALASLPLFMGALAQTVLPTFQPGGGRRRAVMWMLVVELVCCVMVVGLLRTGSSHGEFWIVLLATVHGAAGFASGPTWNDWIADVVPQEEHGMFFSRKGSIGILSSAAAFAVAKGLLDVGKRNGVAETTVCVQLYVFAALLRVLNMVFIGRIDDPAREGFRKADTVKEKVQLFRETVTAKPVVLHVLAYIALETVASTIEDSFLQKRLLDELGVDLSDIAVINIVSVFAKAAASSYWGRFINDHGAWKICVVGSGLTVCSRMISILTDRTKSLLVVSFMQILHSVMYAGYRSAYFSLFLEVIPSNATAVVTWVNDLASGALNFVAGFAASFVFQHGPKLLPLNPSDFPLILGQIVRVASFDIYRRHSKILKKDKSV